MIENGDVTPTSADETYFGDVVTVGANKVGTFRIDNLGSSDLLLDGTPVISISGVNPGDFTVTTEPTATVSGGAYTTFEITFDPTALGTRTALVTIDNNDLDEDPYTFVIEGTGVSVGTPWSCTATRRESSSRSGRTICASMSARVTRCWARKEIWTAGWQPSMGRPGGMSPRGATQIRGPRSRASLTITRSTQVGRRSRGFTLNGESTCGNRTTCRGHFRRRDCRRSVSRRRNMWMKLVTCSRTSGEIEMLRQRSAWRP